MITVDILQDSVKMMARVFLLMVVVVLMAGTSHGWGEAERVRLEDVQVLTLTRGAMTTGRRSAPLPQLHCVGGTGRDEVQPDSVQCYNRGMDGRGVVQWECMADMDNGLKFGQVEVMCEGFDYPGDTYILAGSCGLQYYLELTEEGRERKRQGAGTIGGNGHGHGGGRKAGGRNGGRRNGGESRYESRSYGSTKGEPIEMSVGDFLWWVVVGLVCFILLAVCCGSPAKKKEKENIGGGGWVDPSKSANQSNETKDDCGTGGTRYRGKEEEEEEKDGTESSGRRKASGFGGTWIR